MTQDELAKIIVSIFLSLSVSLISISFAFFIFNITILIRKIIKLLDQANSISGIISTISKVTEIILNLLKKNK